MSRIGKKPIAIPQSVTTSVDAGAVTIKGPKGELLVSLLRGVTIELQEGQLLVKKTGTHAQASAFHGLIRSLLANAVIGVSTGFKKTLKLVGTGYRVQAQGKNLSLSVGYSHPVDFIAPAGIELKVEGNDTIHIEGIDKQAVGQTAAKIREIRPPEPYKGKGVRYEDEVVRLKAGKTAS